MKKLTLLDKIPEKLRNMELPPSVWIELAARHDEIEKLRAVLKPFADADISGHSHKDDRAWIQEPIFQLGDFRRAHDLLYPPVLPKLP